MPIIRQKMIYRADLKANPKTLYLFGDNMERTGMGGQAGEMRGAFNAIGIATKMSPTMEEDAFFYDTFLFFFLENIVRELQPVVGHLMNRGLVVIPEDGLGTGLSELPKRAPKINRILNELIFNLEEQFNVVTPLKS